MKAFALRALEAIARERPLITEAWWMLGLGLIYGAADGPVWLRFCTFAAGYAILSWQRKS